MIYFLHGYLSSPASDKANLLKHELGAIPIKYRSNNSESLIISQCLEQIEITIQHDQNSVLIGSSLGGYLSILTAFFNKNVKKLILLNPAIIPPYIDVTKKDLIAHSMLNIIPQSILKDMKCTEFFREKIRADVNIIIGVQDELIQLGWMLDFAYIQEATVKFLMDDHRFSKNLLILPGLISRLL
jgi:predicted esterase YcpF (UPF0227 family)